MLMSMRSKQKFSLPKYATLLLAACIVLPLSTKILESAVKPKQLSNDVLVTENATTGITDDFSTNYLADLVTDNPLVTLQPQPPQDLWWVTEDGWNILVPETEAYAATIPNAFQELGNETATSSQLVSQAVTTLASQGFTKNKANTSRSIPQTGQIDPLFYDYLYSLSKPDAFCMILVNPDSTAMQDPADRSRTIPVPNTRISCSTASHLQTAKDEQMPFLAALQKEYPTESFVITIQIQTDTAASVRVHNRRTGFGAILAKIDDQWKVIYSGQDQPMCADLQKYKIPPQVHSECNLTTD